MTDPSSQQNNSLENGDDLRNAEFPLADVSTLNDPCRSWFRQISRLWILTVICLFVAIVLVIYSRYATGLNITIQFRNGHGIEPGNPVQYQGIDVGKVVAVELNNDLDGVDVSVNMLPNSGKLTRQGTQFWIERPRVSVAEIRGLETLISGRFIGVTPNPSDAPRITHFIGLESPPAGELPMGGLEIVLEANQRGGLRRGAPLLYRGLPIGHIISVILAPNAKQVEARAFVLPNYRHLVCENSIFWDVGGFNISVGLTGIQLGVDTLATILLGGISMHTPDNSGEPVSADHHFSVDNDVDEKKLLGWIEGTR